MPAATILASLYCGSYGLGEMGGRTWLYQKGREEHLKKISNLRILKRLVAWEVGSCPTPSPDPSHYLLASG